MHLPLNSEGVSDAIAENSLDFSRKTTQIPGEKCRPKNL